MTQTPPQQELAEALESFLALPGTPELLDAQLWARTHELQEKLKTGPLDEVMSAQLQAILEIGGETVQHRLSDLDHEEATLSALLQKNRTVAQMLEEKLEVEQLQGKEAWQSFSIARKLIARQGAELLARLGNEHIEKLIARNLGEILASPTTSALTQAMQSLTSQAATLFENSQRQDRQIKLLVDAVYARFNDVPGMTLEAPDLPDLDDYRQALRTLEAKAREFCRRPINLMTDKTSLAKKFGMEVVTPLRILFKQIRMETERWLKEITTPLQDQIQEKKVDLEQREENLDKILDYIVTLETRLEEAENACASLRRQDQALALIRQLAQPAEASPS